MIGTIIKKIRTGFYTNLCKKTAKQYGKGLCSVSSDDRGGGSGDILRKKMAGKEVRSDVGCDV